MIYDNEKFKIRKFLNEFFDYRNLPAITTRREILTYIREYLNNCEEMIDRNEPRAKKERKIKTAYK